MDICSLATFCCCYVGTLYENTLIFTKRTLTQTREQRSTVGGIGYKVEEILFTGMEAACILRFFYQN